jgi:hypothetical protein
VAVVLPGGSDGGDGGAVAGSRAEGLRVLADRAREASSRALESADGMLARGLASEARNASVVSGVHAERAAELEASARLEEAHEVAMSEATGRLVIGAIERGFEDLGLPVPSVFVAELLRGWPAPVDEAVLEQARVDVRRAIVAEVRVELSEEMAVVRQAQQALPRGEDASDDDEGGEPVGEEEPVDAEVVGESELEEGELPDDIERDSAGNLWRKPFVDHLGIQHSREAVVTSVVREPREGGLPRRRSRFDFSHPGMAG